MIHDLTARQMDELRAVVKLDGCPSIFVAAYAALIAAAEREQWLLMVIEQCDIVMDTAATLGLPQDLPQVYRDSWAAAHLAARFALEDRPT